MMLRIYWFLLLLLQEAARNDNGRAAHSEWRNYDDFNEYFWLVMLFCINIRIYCSYVKRCKTLKFLCQFSGHLLVLT